MSVDLARNEDASESVVIEQKQDLVEQAREVTGNVERALQGNKLDAVLCVAGGWAGGSIASDDLVRNVDLVFKQSVWSSIIASRIAAMHLREGGLIQLTGAEPALGATPTMIGYGMAKASVHQLIKSLAHEKSGMPKDVEVVAILPITLDTPMNRKFMPKADPANWTPLAFLADLLYQWATSSTNRPKTGTLVVARTEGGHTKLEMHH